MRRGGLCLFLSLGRDCVFPLLPAHHADHLHYRNLGHELPLHDIVPLHWKMHDVVGAVRKTPLRPLLTLYLRQSYLVWIGVEVYAVWFVVQWVIKHRGA